MKPWGIADPDNKENRKHIKILRFWAITCFHRKKAGETREKIIGKQTIRAMEKSFAPNAHLLATDCRAILAD